MHDLVAVEKIIRVAERIILDLPAKPKFIKLNLLYGAIGGVEPKHFEEHFREKTKGTILENVELSFKEDIIPYRDVNLESIEVE